MKTFTFPVKSKIPVKISSIASSMWVKTPGFSPETVLSINFIIIIKATCRFLRICIIISSELPHPRSTDIHLGLSQGRNKSSTSAASDSLPDHCCNPPLSVITKQDTDTY